MFLSNTLNNNTIYKKLFAGSERSTIVKKNIIGSLLIKGISILVLLYLVPFTLNLLNREKYGIWITIYSIVSWFNMMDFGLGNGFRNKFAEAIALDKKDLAKEYMSTFYSSMVIIAFAILLLFSLAYPFLNWHKVLNISKNFDENLNMIIWLIFCLFSFQLVLKNISTVLLALQKTTQSNALILLSNIIVLIGLFFLKKLHIVNLFSISMTFMISPCLIYLIVSMIIFNGELKLYRPRFAIPMKTNFNSLMTLGIKFFLIQITTIILFASSNLIITQLYGPSEVAPYDIANRMFVSILTFYTIIITPFWTAFTGANAKNDIKWIINSIDKLKLFWIIFSLCVMIFWVLSPWILKLWIGDKIEINYLLSLQFAVYVILMSWQTPYVFYISAIGKIKLELFIAIFQLLIYLPLALFLAKFIGLNLVGIILATNINILIPAILIYIQYKKLIYNNAYGIWAQ